MVVETTTPLPWLISILSAFAMDFAAGDAANAAPMVRALVRKLRLCTWLNLSWSTERPNVYDGLPRSFLIDAAQ